MNYKEPVDFIMIRGLARETRHWDRFPGILKKRLPGARFHYVEIPGNGKLSKIKSPLHICDYVLSMRMQIANKLKKKTKNVWFIGVSLGGMIAFEWLRMFPDDANGAILINTSSGSLSPPWNRLKPSSFHVIYDYIKADNPLERERISLSCVSEKNHPESLIKKFAKFREENQPSFQNIVRQIIAATLFRGRYLNKSKKYLLLASSNDRFVNSSCSYHISKYHRIELRMHPDAGHELSLDDPDWMADQIEHWILFQE